jgi:hypothetical protein
MGILQSFCKKETINVENEIKYYSAQITVNKQTIKEIYKKYKINGQDISKFEETFSLLEKNMRSLNKMLMQYKQIKQLPETMMLEICHHKNDLNLFYKKYEINDDDIIILRDTNRQYYDNIEQLRYWTSK